MSGAAPDPIPAYLQRAAKRDQEKGGGGLRSTREVADYFGLSLAAARRRLAALELAGLVECLGPAPEPGRPLLWRAAPRPDNDNDDGELAPARLAA